MKFSPIIIAFSCALLSLALVCVLWIVSPQTDATANAESGFNRRADNVVGNETPFKPEW